MATNGFTCHTACEYLRILKNVPGAYNSPLLRPEKLAQMAQLFSHWLVFHNNKINANVDHTLVVQAHYQLGRQLDRPHKLNTDIWIAPEMIALQAFLVSLGQSTNCVCDHGGL